MPAFPTVLLGARRPLLLSAPKGAGRNHMLGVYAGHASASDGASASRACCCRYCIMIAAGSAYRYACGRTASHVHLACLTHPRRWRAGQPPAHCCWQFALLCIAVPSAWAGAPALVRPCAHTG